MKTTVEISDPLLKQARKRAEREGTTLRELIERGLRMVVIEGKPEQTFRLRRASFMGKGLNPEMRDASWERIRQLAYEDRAT